MRYQITLSLLLLLDLVSPFAPRITFRNYPHVAYSSTQHVMTETHATICLKMTSSLAADDSVAATDGESLQIFFSKHCDKDGLMSKNTLVSLPIVSEMMTLGDLLEEEFDNIWKAAPKFPDDETSIDRVDVDSFVQIYRDIDEIFEDDSVVEKKLKVLSSEQDISNDIDQSKDPNEIGDKEQLEQVFNSLSDSLGLLSRESLEAWSEIQNLLQEGLLGKDEFEDLWNKNKEIAESSDKLNLDGFVSFNNALDELFNFEDEDEDIMNSTGITSVETLPSDAKSKTDIIFEDGSAPSILFEKICDNNFFVGEAELKRWGDLQEMLSCGDILPFELENILKEVGGSDQKLNEKDFTRFYDDIESLFEDDGGKDNVDVATSEEKIVKSVKIVYEEDLPSGVLFSKICDKNFLVGKTELARWGELQEMLSDGDLLPHELGKMFDKTSKESGTSDKLNEEGFLILHDEINSLFEDEEDSAVIAVDWKSRLFELLAQIEKVPERLPCGLQCTENEIETVLAVVTTLEAEPCNICSSDEKCIEEADLAGDWDLLYTSSSKVKYNQGLSGLVPPKGRLDNLVQKIRYTKYLSDVEYIEKIYAGPTSFEVRITGDWELQSSESLFTGKKSIALSVVPDKVFYGPAITRADHWGSVSPMNLLDISYLDNDLRIMRGSTSVDTIFIFKKR